MDPKAHKRNLFGFSMIEVFWGMGFLGLTNPANIITVYLKRLGASNFEISLVPAFSYLGLLGFQILGAYFTSHLRKLKSVLIIWCMVLSLPWLGQAIMALYTSPGEKTKMYIFILFHLLFWMGLGPMVPVWNAFLAKVFDPRKLGRAFGTIFFFHVLVAGFGAWIASRIIEYEKFGFENTYFLLCLMTFLLLGAPSLFLLFVKGEEESKDKKKVGFGEYFSVLVKVLKQDVNFLKYLIARLLSFVAPLLIYFYAVHGTTEHNLSASQAAFLATVALGAQAPACYIMGWVADRFNPKITLSVGYTALFTGLVSILVADGMIGFSIGSAAIGIYYGSEIVGHNAFILTMYDENSQKEMLGITALAVLPFAVGLPLIGGRLIDLYSFDAIMPFTGISILLGLLMLIFGVKGYSQKV